MNIETNAGPLSTADFERRLTALIPALSKRAGHFHKRAEDREDLVQETLCKALAHRELFDPQWELIRWLGHIMRNGFIDRVRTERGWACQSLQYRHADGTAPNQEWFVLGRDVQSALDRMPRSNSVPLVMIALGDTYQQVALSTGVELATVKTRVRRARIALALEFGPMVPPAHRGAFAAGADGGDMRDFGDEP